MKEVYVLAQTIWYEKSEVLGVFSSEKSALDACKEHMEALFGRESLGAVTIRKFDDGSSEIVLRDHSQTFEIFKKEIED